MNKIITIIITSFLTISCASSELKNALKEGEYKVGVIELGALVDSTYYNNSQLKSADAIANMKKRIVAKIIDSNGESVETGVEQAISLYIENRNVEQIERYPVFEVRGTSKIILPFYGDGQWGRIWGQSLFDKKSMVIENASFGHKNETPGLGSRITSFDFYSKFVGQRLTLENPVFSLYQDGQKVIDGKIRIDGMSGATVTSKAAVDMLNEGFVMYEKTLNFNEESD